MWCVVGGAYSKVLAYTPEHRTTLRQRDASDGGEGCETTGQQEKQKQQDSWGTERVSLASSTWLQAEEAPIGREVLEGAPLSTASPHRPQVTL